MTLSVPHYLAILVVTIFFAITCSLPENHPFHAPHRRINVQFLPHAETQGRLPPSLPAPPPSTRMYTCEQNKTAIVSSSGAPCVPLHNLTAREYIHRVSTDRLTYLYCSLPKNGCSYHLGLMQRANGLPYRGKDAIHVWASKSKIILSDADEALRLLTDPTVPKYTVVRNPLTKVLSAYLCKVEAFLPEDERTVARFHAWLRHEFAGGIEDWETVDEHWRAQTTLCGFSSRNLPNAAGFRLFRHEQPQDFVAFLYSFVPREFLDTGWDQNPKRSQSSQRSFRDFVLGPRQRTSNTKGKFFMYVNETWVFDLLVKTYRRDVEMLGYEKEIGNMRLELLTRENRRIDANAK